MLCLHFPASPLATILSWLYRLGISIRSSPTLELGSLLSWKSNSFSCRAEVLSQSELSQHTEKGKVALCLQEPHLYVHWWWRYYLILAQQTESWETTCRINSSVCDSERDSMPACWCAGNTLYGKWKRNSRLRSLLDTLRKFEIVAAFLFDYMDKMRNTRGSLSELGSWKRTFTWVKVSVKLWILH